MCPCCILPGCVVRIHTSICQCYKCARAVYCQDVLELLEKRVKSRFSHRQIHLLPAFGYNTYIDIFKSTLKLPQCFGHAKFAASWNAHIDVRCLLSYQFVVDEQMVFLYDCCCALNVWSVVTEKYVKRWMQKIYTKALLCKNVLDITYKNVGTERTFVVYFCACYVKCHGTNCFHDITLELIKCSFKLYILFFNN